MENGAYFFGGAVPGICRQYIFSNAGTPAANGQQNIPMIVNNVWTIYNIVMLGAV